MSRENNREDVTINGVEYMLIPGEEGYSKDFVRVIVQQQQIAGTKDQLTSRPDIRPMFQTSWAGGMRWELPLVSAESIDVYGLSEGFDMVTQPGNLYALPDINSIAAGTINDNPFVLQREPNIVYHFETQQASLGLSLWDGSNFTILTNDFGNNANAVPIAMCWSQPLGTVFALFNESGVAGAVKYVTPDSAGGQVVAGVTGGIATGANIFMHEGRLMVYNGINLQEYTAPLGSPVESTVFDDGLGHDWLNLVENTTDPIIPKWWGTRLAVGTAEGVYIVKNVVQNGLPTPFIYRVETTNDGQDIGSPIATLPQGLVCLNITYHLGSLILACSPDLHRVVLNDLGTNGHAETIFYQFNQENGLGTIGSPQGPAFGGAAITTACRFLGSLGNLLYIGSFDRIWVYDSGRGGLHPTINDSQSAAFGSWGSMAITQSGAGVQVIQFFHDDSPGLEWPRVDIAGKDDTHQLDSVYFDGNLPGELKSVYAVTLMTDGLKANETLTVSLAPDDAAFASVAVYDTDGDKTVRKEFATVKTGFRFRYRLAYTCSSDVSTPSIVKGIIFWMVAGEMLTQWQFRLDLSSSLNLKNKKVSLDTQWTNLETLGGTATFVTLIDNYRSPENAQTTHETRVSSVKQVRTTPMEGFADVILVEHNLNN